MGTDGRAYVFMAEMVERGPGYLSLVEPIPTVVAGVDIDSLDVYGHDRHRHRRVSPDVRIGRSTRVHDVDG